MTQPHEPAPLRAQVRFAMTPEWVLFHEKLSLQAKVLYGVLDRHVDGHGRCFPGRTRLARLCGMSARSVDAAVQELRDVGALEARSRWVDGAGQVYYERGQGRTQTSTEYTLLALARAPQDVRRAGHAQAPHDVPPNESPSCNEREFTSRQAKSQRPDDPWEIYSGPPARHLATTAEGKPIPGSQNW